MTRRLLIFTLALLLFACTSTRVTRDKIEALEVGMTETQVVEKIGRPTDINRTKAAGYTRAQFVYPLGQYERAYVYFEDGYLSSVQY